MKDFIVIALVGALIVFGLWAWFAGPCWMYTFSAAGEVPARCLMDGE